MTRSAAWKIARQPCALETWDGIRVLPPPGFDAFTFAPALLSSGMISGLPSSPRGGWQSDRTSTRAHEHSHTAFAKPKRWASLSPPPPLPPPQRRVIGCESAEEGGSVGFGAAVPVQSFFSFFCPARMPAISLFRSLEQPPCRARFEGGRRSHSFGVYTCSSALRGAGAWVVGAARFRLSCFWFVF